MVVGTPSTCDQEPAATIKRDQQQGQQQQYVTQDQQHNRFIFSVSAGWSPALYWLGSYNYGTFTPAKVPEATQVAKAGGASPAAGGGTVPKPLDLGDLLYAPNVLKDAKVSGRILHALLVRSYE